MKNILLIAFFIIITLIVYKLYIKETYEKLKYNLVVAAAFKNESHILKEWIDHYIHHGFEHIYLINDGSTDNYKEILKPYIESGKVTLFENKFKIDTYPRQKFVYSKHLLPVLSESKWWAILDLDEFLYCPEEINIGNIIKKYDSSKISQIHARWVMYGSNGHIEQPVLVVPNFLKRKKDIEGQVKSIFRGEDLIDFDVHTHKVKGDSVIDESILINHYAIQSWKFFERVKMTRGDVNLYAQTVGVVRDKSYFEKYDYKDIIDDRLYRQNKSLF
jgi:hypothetical protein